MDIDSWMHRGPIAKGVGAALLILAALPVGARGGEIVATLMPTSLEWSTAPARLAVNASTPSSLAALGMASQLARVLDEEPATVIDFEVNAPRQLRLEVVDLDGRLVRTIAEGRWARGHHRLAWQHDTQEGERAASGRYVVRLADVTGTASPIAR